MSGKTIVKTLKVSYNKSKQKKEALKSLESLTLADRFLFFKVMQDGELSEMGDVTPELGNFLKYLAEGVAVDEYTERLVEAVETAKKDPRLMVEYMSYYAEQADRRAEREESRAAGLEEGLEKGMVRGVIQTIKAVQGTKEQAAQQLMIQCGMSEEEAFTAVEKCW